MTALHKHQSGISIIAAIVLLLGLAILGSMVAVLTSTQSESTINEWYSAQALYAAESATQIAAYQINQSGGNCDAPDTAGPVQLEAGLAAWYTIQSGQTTISGINVCQITASGMAGGSDANPVAQRQITVDYKSVVVP